MRLILEDIGMISRRIEEPAVHINGIAQEKAACHHVGLAPQIGVGRPAECLAQALEVVTVGRKPGDYPPAPTRAAARLRRSRPRSRSRTGSKIAVPIERHQTFVGGRRLGNACRRAENACASAGNGAIAVITTRRQGQRCGNMEIRGKSEAHGVSYVLQMSVRKIVSQIAAGITRLFHSTISASVFRAGSSMAKRRIQPPFVAARSRSPKTSVFGPATRNAKGSAGKDRAKWRESCR